MATLNVSVTQSNVLLTSAVSSGSTLDFVIDNPIPYTSYFTLETVADNNGFYTNSTSKNTSGSFTLGTGQFGLIQSDYIASVVVPSGSTTLNFVPAVNIPASTLYLRGIGAGPYSTITSFTGLLDTYSGAAAAYSVRLLSSTYAGSAIRVRRSSDNTEQNIGFDSSGNLDTASLLSFCGAGNGFVTTWYDQSGNGNNATQTTAANQPQIVSAGSVITLNSKPSLLTDGTNDSFTISTINTSGSNFTLFNIGKRSAAAVKYVGMASNTFPGQGHLFWNDNKYYLQKSLGYLTSGTTYATANHQIMSGVDLQTTATNTQYVNGSVIASTFSGYSFTQNFDRLFSIEATNFSSGNCQEIILWLSNQTSNLSGINTNMNAYYGIY